MTNVEAERAPALDRFSRLMWFHAFRRKTAQEVIAVLKMGAEPSPNPCATQVHEARLGISPPCVYAYLGRTLEEFGDAAFALRFNELPSTGTLSPFDTGGLVNHIEPVRSWPEDAQRRFLEFYSWPAAARGSALKEYPTEAGVDDYLNNAQPSNCGPRGIWSRPHPGMVWTSPMHWRAWTWEGRWPMIPTGEGIVGWSCSASTFKKVTKLAESVSDDNERRWHVEMNRRYVAGGVRHFVDEFLSRQQ